jgi:hypothetical protein
VQSGYGKASRERRNEKKPKRHQAREAHIAETGEIGKGSKASRGGKVSREKTASPGENETAPRQVLHNQDSGNSGARKPQTPGSQTDHARAAPCAQSASEIRSGEYL